jgi:oxygen-independent coproporphyrinogen-3 oxidase
LLYWNYGDYAGVGPGAHGRLTLNGEKIATEAPRQPEDWLKRVQTTGSANTDVEIISPDDQSAEYVMMSLRLTAGCDLRRAARLSPTRIDSHALVSLITDGYLTQTNTHLRTTAKGRLVLNAVLGKLLNGEASNA